MILIFFCIIREPNIPAKMICPRFKSTKLCIIIMVSSHHFVHVVWTCFHKILLNQINALLEQSFKKANNGLGQKTRYHKNI